MATIKDMLDKETYRRASVAEGLAMGNIPPGKGGSPGQPYQAPQEDPKNPYVPAPKRIANLADGEADPSMMYYPTENGFFLDGTGKAYMQTGGKLYDAGEYNIETHGLPVPLAQQMQINPDIARDFTYDAEPGGVATPRYFTPPEMRDYFRTPAIQEKELFHFNNFIRSLGPGLDTVQRRTPLSIG